MICLQNIISISQLSLVCLFQRIALAVILIIDVLRYIYVYVLQES